MLVRVYPQRIAGDDPVFEQEERRFDLTYVANTTKSLVNDDFVGSTAPTLVFVPPRLKAVKATFNDHAVPFDPRTNLVSVQNEGSNGTRQKLHIEWQ